MACPSGEQLLAFHLGELDEAQIATVGEHLTNCERCELRARHFDDLNDTALSALRHSREPGSMPGTVEAIRRPLAPADRSPAIPGYESLGLLGGGGMGLVWKARHGRLDRLVALKCLRTAGTAELRRFQAEAQAVARLSHPDIVQIFEVGEHEGQPYLTLEYLEGGTLADRLDGKPQDPRTSATLVQTLARAVHYAHGRGIVHRDLKPGNVLFTAAGQPKIADFGIAKHLHAEGQTRAGDIVGTARYMAPEQAIGHAADIGPASDIYSLGVILYELLTGRVPLQGPTDLDTALLVRNEEPVPPRRLQPGVPRDLETICLKCLRKEPGARYASAEDLALDLGRQLAGEPISARPTPRWERAWKWTKRRPAVAALVALSALILCVGFPGATYLWLRADRDRRQAQTAATAERIAWMAADKERAVAQAVNEFIQNDLLGQADSGNQPAGQRNKDVTVRELLDRAAAGLEKRFTGQELTEAALRQTLGKAYQSIGGYREARQHLERAVALRTTKLGAEHQDTLKSMNDLASVWALLGDPGRAATLYEQVLQGFSRQLGADHPDTLATLGNLALLDAARGRYDEAERQLKRVIDGFRVAYGADHERTLQGMNNLAALYGQCGRLDDAERLSEQVVAGYRRRLAGDHPLALQSMNNLATMYLLHRRHDKAEPLLNEVLKARRATLSDMHPDTLATMHDLAVVYLETDRLDAAEAMFREALSASRIKPGPQHPLTFKLMNGLAMLCHQRGKFTDAERLFQEVLEARRTALGADHPETLLSMHNLGVHYRERASYAEAEPLLLEAATRARDKLPASHPYTGQFTEGLAALYDVWGMPDKAAEWRARLAPPPNE